MSKNVFKKFGKWVDDKVSYHLTQQEEKIKKILEGLLDQKDTLKYTPNTGTYYVQNQRLNAIVKITNTSVHASVNGVLLMITCNMASAAKLKDIILAQVSVDTDEVEKCLSQMSSNTSDKILGYIKSTDTITKQSYEN